MQSYKTEVVFYVWDIEEKEKETLNNMGGALNHLADTFIKKELRLHFRVFDGNKHEAEPLNNNLIICFGHEAIDACSHYQEIIEMPSVKSINRECELKKEAWSILQVVANLIAEGEIPITKSVEKDNVSFGIGADIEITEQDANHLKKIRDLLGGGKMVITKGKLRIEVGK